MIQRNPILRKLIQPKRIPLLFSVTIVSSIFYYYAPKLAWLWIILSIVIQAMLFQLFDYIKKHPLRGGIVFVLVGALFVIASFGLIRLGTATPPFAPDNPYRQIDFMVWFLTPQSVLTMGTFDGSGNEVVSAAMQMLSTEYLGYTLALFMLFTMFVATITYYYTLVRYRVLMSFVVMIFPFMIYARENETMPELSMIILLVCYFTSMIYCRQAHGEDASVVQKYEPDAVSRLSMPSKKSAYAKVKPEFLDGAFFHATGVFMASATILVLVLPKPEIEADRSMVDTLYDMSSLSDTLMGAISAFTDSSDGGTYSDLNYTRVLYYTQAREPLNLRVRTFSDYHYDTDSWQASDYDGMPQHDHPLYVQKDGYQTVSDEVDPAQLVSAIHSLAKTDSDFASEYSLETLAALPEQDLEAYYLPLQVDSAAYNSITNAFPAPLHIRSVEINKYNNIIVDGYMNQSSVLFDYKGGPRLGETYTLQYLSERFANTDPAQTLMKSIDSETWELLLQDGLARTKDDPEANSVFTRALQAYSSAAEYAADRRFVSETPENVCELALQLTEGLHSDYEKAMAIRDYLRFSDEFFYSLDYRITDADNVETFLFQNKIGVCYQFASAMVEMCRAVGLNVRYVEGYSMSVQDNRLFRGSAFDYVITTDEGHAFVDVYIPGYGWMMMDATSGNVIQQKKMKVNVLATLQYSGLILLGVAVMLLILLKWFIPLLQEVLFRRKFRNRLDAASVAAAFARLRKQWNADPAQTARTLCAEKSSFLQMDLQVLLDGFERAVYAGRCDTETAKQVYQVYCAVYDAWKPACKRKRQADKQARKAAKRVSSVKAV